MKEPEYKCTCGAPMNEGEAKTFTCCDACWDKAFPKKEATPEGENKPDFEALVKEFDKRVEEDPDFTKRAPYGDKMRSLRNAVNEAKSNAKPDIENFDIDAYITSVNIPQRYNPMAKRYDFKEEDLVNLFDQVETFYEKKLKAAEQENKTLRQQLEQNKGEQKQDS